MNTTPSLDPAALDAAQYLAHAEKLAAFAPQFPATGRAFKQAAVLGAGTMGRGIAMCLANAGIAVALIDNNAAALENAARIIEDTYAASTRKGKITAARADAARQQIRTATDLAAAARADVVIEAVFEDLPLKQQIFTALSAIVAPGCLLASNTSFLDIDKIAQAVQDPARMVGLHFFSPAHIMPLVEVVQSEHSSNAALADAMALVRTLGKQPVAMRACDGFVGNRMLSRRTVEAESLLLHGASPQEVDAVLTAFGFPMGPFAMTDMAGVDVNWRTRQARGLPLAIADAVYAAGRLGQKTGQGYYRYEDGSRKPLPDPAVTDIIDTIAQAQGIVRAPMAPASMFERLVYPMINEGMRILEEGIVPRASDIDVVWRYGYGWPAESVGPMRYADQIGLGVVSVALARMAKQTGRQTLAPAPLLLRLAGEGASVVRAFA
ncbi:3-hydroxyacyl-CoA dehydrogenase NAD-binding domain-containing protein [Achromobacter sp. NPDC058515]|uniref:3-hydroxyacyl-CoA dehydrogenase n=1 Tax=Achromobacter sp. NPDC058515 TaxID=3346533 RepID=UPI00364E2F80